MFRIAGIIAVAFLVSYCGTRTGAEPDTSLTLVAMMRVQEADVLSLRQRIVDGDTLLADIHLKHDFLEGTPSSPDKNDRNFPELSAAFVEAFNELKSTPAKTEQFNLMIASCIDCHEQFCPGPIRQIKKLQIEQ
jgi:hypothetical protein